jgi:hypothetical protein
MVFQLTERTKMVLKIYSIRDTKGEVFHAPYFKTTHGEAERSFRQAANDDKTTISQFPEDFDLYYLGEYDDNTGKFKNLDTPQHVIKAIHCVKTKENTPKL